MSIIIEKLTTNEFGDHITIKNPSLDRETCQYFANKRSCYKCYGRGYITWDNRLESCRCVEKNMKRQGLDINKLIEK